MLEISTSGLMSGDGKRSGPFRAQPPRPSSTLPIRDRLKAISRPSALALFLSSSPWPPKPHTLSISVDELDATRFEGGPDFSDRSLSSA